MRYVVTVDGETVEVQLDGHTAVVGESELDVELDEAEGTPIRLVTIDGVVNRVVVRRGDQRGQYALWLGGHRYEVEALDERMRAIRALTASSVSLGPAPVLAPMPGLIVRVDVSPGDVVAAGQGLVVMEAMKMENELRATSAGTVRAVRASAGQAVEKGAVLVELE